MPDTLDAKAIQEKHQSLITVIISFYKRRSYNV